MSLRHWVRRRRRAFRPEASARAASALFVAALLLLIACPPVHAQVPFPVHLVPVVGAGPEGATLPISLEVANLGLGPVTVGLRLFGAAGGGAFDGSFPVSFAVLPGRTQRFEDLPVAVRGVRHQRGWLLVADVTPADCASSERPFPALLAVRAALGTGTPWQPSWLAVNTAGQPSVLPIPAGDGEVTLAVANVGGVALPLRVTLAGADGQTRGLARRRVESLSAATWTLPSLGVHARPGERLEVALDDPSGALGPCFAAAQPLPCADPCDREACPQRYRLPGGPAFAAVLVRTRGRSADVVWPVIDHVGAARLASRYRLEHCPALPGSAGLADLFGKLALLRDPRPVLRKL